jgi:signal transduction histidine kinase
MQIGRNNSLFYIVLLGIWVLVVVWQVDEHDRVREAAKTDLRNRTAGIANTVSAIIRASKFRGAVVQDRIEPVLNLLVSTNALVKPNELLSITLLNTNGDPVASVGNTNLFSRDVLAGSELWSEHYVSFVLPVEGVGVSNNSTVLLPSPRGMTNEMRGADRNFPPPGSPDEPPTTPSADNASNNVPANPAAGGPVNPADQPPPDNGIRHGPPRGRPPWLRWMSESDFKTLVATHELHGLVLAMSTDNYRAVCIHDLWLRFIIIAFASLAAAGAGLAARNLSQTAELQIRLVRASELNSHLREMNLAAAGLAHETRNPLNIIRGMAQMLSKQPSMPPDIREKSRAIVDETDKVTAQLNEFINYSRPREVRRARVALNAAVTEVVRTLTYDIEEKKLHVETGGEPLAIEADEQLLRQVLFNLLLNAVQAADVNGRIQISARRSGADEAALEIRDDGPGVPPDQRLEIFKPYFTTNQKGTGLGLAVVQQIVLAHGWEIVCLTNEPKGALFRITHLKVV